VSKGARVSAADLPRRYQDQIAAQYGSVRLITNGPVITNTKAKRRIRQTQKPLLNKLETRFESHLATRFLEEDIFPQAIRLELARGHWYKPDFFVMDTMDIEGGHRGTFYEVKGPHSFRGGFENLKVAARRFQQFRFVLAWRDNENGCWQKQMIMP